MQKKVAHHKCLNKQHNTTSEQLICFLHLLLLQMCVSVRVFMRVCIYVVYVCEDEYIFANVCVDVPAYYNVPGLLVCMCVCMPRCMP